MLTQGDHEGKECLQSLHRYAKGETLRYRKRASGPKEEIRGLHSPPFKIYVGHMNFVLKPRHDTENHS